jgi:hypothetical protein
MGCAEPCTAGADRYTYGFRSATILATLLNNLILLVATGAICMGSSTSSHGNETMFCSVGVGVEDPESVWVPFRPPQNQFEALQLAL